MTYTKDEVLNMEMIKIMFNGITKKFGSCTIKLIEDITETVETFNSFEELAKSSPALEILSTEVKGNIIEIYW